MVPQLDAAPPSPVPPPSSLPRSSSLPPPSREDVRPGPPRGEPGDDAATAARDRVLLAVGCGLAFGVVLGCWCRVFAHSSSVNGVLANLASPWVATAFATGAVAAARPGGAHVVRPVREAIAGALGGTVCLVVATIVYYGPARTGAFDFDGAVFRTAFWSSAGIAAGVVFGAAGAVWRTASSRRLRAACSVAFGLILLAETVFLVGVGATKYDAFSWPVLLAVGAIGVAIPLLLGPADEAPKAAGWVVIVAVPVVLGGLLLLSVMLVAARAIRPLL